MALLRYPFSGLIAGLDEAGRGPLAGPVVAAAVILPKRFQNPLLNDSKKLSEKKRKELRKIIEAEALEWHVESVSPEEIDEMNILQASFLAMHKCIDHFLLDPELLLIDGNRFRPYKSLSHKCIVKGDGKYLSIAAASILAKTHRDDMMEYLHYLHPEYNWMSNKGYPTQEHRNAIRSHGLSPFHRKTFRHLPEQIEIPFQIKQKKQ
jgi:ribonuclease HII